MPNPLVECIPNFSEARRPEVVDAIKSSIQKVPGVMVLDQHSDTDHNRTVITYVGTPDGAEEAAFQSIRTAAQWIDLNNHRGEHPRLGATDVFPFVPIRDISMQECIEIARRLAKRVGDELHIPVYLYEEAASRPERKNLEDIRRGEYEALKQEIGVRQERDPDFGPRRVGPAGAVVIGARQPLIAFNVFLTTDNVAIAQKIARAVRHSSGGLRYVKALGLLVDGKAQVSMNLTNFHQTPVARVVEIVRREAERYGVGIQNTELVGLIPQEALVDAAVWYMQLDMFHPHQVLEQRIQQAQADSEALAQQAAPQYQEASFLEAVAAATPTPGGGSASAHTGATAAALVGMVSRLTLGKKKYAQVENRMQEIAAEADRLRAELDQAVEVDSASFEQYLTAVRMPKDTPAEQAAREEAIQQAVKATILAPMNVSRLSIQVLRLAYEAASAGNINALSDAGSAAVLARAALSGSVLNVRTNCPALKDTRFVEKSLAELREIQAEAARIENELNSVFSERGNLAD